MPSAATPKSAPDPTSRTILPGSHVAIYVHGPVHDFPERAARDAQIRDRMEDAGWLVIRFHQAAEWLAIAQRYPSVFGPPSGSQASAS